MTFCCTSNSCLELKITIMYYNNNKILQLRFGERLFEKLCGVPTVAFNFNVLKRQLSLQILISMEKVSFMFLRMRQSSSFLLWKAAAQVHLQGRIGNVGNCYLQPYVCYFQFHLPFFPRKWLLNVIKGLKVHVL